MPVSIDFRLESSAAPPTTGTLSFEPGERIRLIVRNNDIGVLHSIRLPGIDDTLRHIRWEEQAVIEFTAPEAGAFEYICPQHAPKMQGRIRIE